eukprot:CAMPEP_0116920516 /NCGR_PEP_ID=MMETSP0467-20121206/21070_1 /TAXON_ID=283647 /ORGANISM="Mesodinium pulex, Strain SPMC105" /LENGTH=57 /DNA_ID=CAMNT_0004598385 /DNA_START=257 /DNA_END=430 /DNA_ORIENTATION=-
MVDNGAATFEPETVDDLRPLVASIRPLGVDEFNDKMYKLKYSMNAKKVKFGKAMGTY